MAIKSILQKLTSRFPDQVTTGVFSLPTLQTALHSLLDGNWNSSVGSYLLVHLPAQILKSMPDPPAGAVPNMLQWHRIDESGLHLETGRPKTSVGVKTRDPFRKELLIFGKFNQKPELIIAREEKTSSALFRSRPVPFTVACSSDPKVLEMVRAVLSEEYPQWMNKFSDRWRIPRRKSETDLYPGFLTMMESMEQNYKSLVMEQWQSQVMQRFQRITLELNPETMIKQVERAFKEHVGYDHFELNVKNYSGLPAQHDGAFSIRESKLGGELLSIILNPEKIEPIIAKRVPTLITDVTNVSIFMNPKLLQIMNIHSGVLIPMWEGNNELGLIKIFFRRRVEQHPDEENLLTDLSKDIGRALGNALRFHLTERRATVDGLTNVFNHRFFMNQFHKEFNRARRYKNALALIMIDLNHFKEYNDANGHPAGDRVLAKVAELIQGAVREIDLVARYGGDEFTLILPENDASHGMIVAEKVRKVIENHPFDNEECVPGGNLTISLGISENSSDIKTAAEMIEIADQALYWVKRHGGNRSKIGNRREKS